MARERRVIEDAVAALQDFSGPSGLTERIGNIERAFNGGDRESIRRLLERERIAETALAGVLDLKRLVGQINVVVHALGILLALPTILEDGEKVESLSLGAGNTGRDFDLVTDRRIAEFTFIAWQGGAETIRQNKLFVDLFHLAEEKTGKRKEMYLTDLDIPRRFLIGRRKLRSVLHRSSLAKEFFDRHGDRFITVADYWKTFQDRVRLVDVTEHVPVLRSADDV
jgi:hypothetical protein